MIETKSVDFIVDKSIILGGGYGERILESYWHIYYKLGSFQVNIMDKFYKKPVSNLNHYYFKCSYSYLYGYESFNKIVLPSDFVIVIFGVPITNRIYNHEFLNVSDPVELSLLNIGLDKLFSVETTYVDMRSYNLANPAPYSEFYKDSLHVLIKGPQLYIEFHLALFMSGILDLIKFIKHEIDTVELYDSNHRYRISVKGNIIIVDYRFVNIISFPTYMFRKALDSVINNGRIYRLSALMELPYYNYYKYRSKYSSKFSNKYSRY